MEERPQKIAGSRWFYLIGGVILGVLLILALRYVTYTEDHTHYHANFAVYIDGQREPFKGQQYYQEVNLCSAEGGMTPPARTHMHNNENGVVHVHDEAVTWGQFFANLGWVIGPDFVRTSDTLLVANDEKQLRIILNGQDLTGISSIVNQPIDNKDRLLVSYGAEDENAVKKQFESVASNAEKYNNKQDPGGCGGTHEPTHKQRLEHLF